MKGPFTIALAAAVLVGAASAQGDVPVTKPGQQTKKQVPVKAAKKKAWPKAIDVGTQVPADLKLPDINGKMHAFGDLRGKVVFIHFWSIKCPWERFAEPKILAMEKEYAKKDVVILAINSNQNEIGAKPEATAFKGKNKPYANLRRHVKKNKVGHPVLVDHGNVVSSLFKARTTPHCYVLNKKGVCVYNGALDDDKANENPKQATNFVRCAMDASLTGAEVEVKTSRPYG